VDVCVRALHPLPAEQQRVGFVQDCRRYTHTLTRVHTVCRWAWRA